MAEETGLKLALSETPKKDFLCQGPSNNPLYVSDGPHHNKTDFCALEQQRGRPAYVSAQFVRCPF